MPNMAEWTTVDWVLTVLILLTVVAVVYCALTGKLSR